MASLFSTNSISRQVLVLVMLLSFLGQAFASSSACVTTGLEISLEGKSTGLESREMMAAPCHQGMASMDVDTEMNLAMDCCDQDSMAIDHSCSCPDGGCAGSLSFISHISTSSLFISEVSAIFKLNRFASQIDSALFRPPIV